MDEFLTLLTELLGADHELVVALGQRGNDDERPWAEMDADALSQLDEALRALADNDEASADVLLLAADAAVEVRAELEARAAEAEAEEARRLEAIARLRGQAETDPDELQPGEGDGDDDEGGDGGSDDGEGDDAPGGEVPEATEPEPVLADGRQLRARRPVALRPVPRANPGGLSTITAAANVGGIPAGAPIRDQYDLARAFQSVYESQRGANWSGAPQKVGVATVRIPELLDPSSGRYLDRNTAETMRKINEAGADTLVAAGGVCGPLEARYDVVGLSDDRRPIRDALPRFGADRGGIRYMPGLEIEDYAGASEVWTEGTDASPGGATKNLLTVTCGTEAECVVDAITMRLQFGNFMGRFAPEWVTATTGEAMAAWARLAENTLWDTMCAGSIAVTGGQGLGATADLLSELSRATASMRSRFRMAPNTVIQALFPDWVVPLLQADLARRAPGDDQLAVTEAQVVAYLRAHGVEPAFSPDGGGQVFTPQAAGVLKGWPSTVEALLFPAGTWLHLDGGELDLGIVRDSTLNGTNDYQTFFESFEQVCRVGVASASWCVTFDLCPDGTTAGPDTNYNPCGSGS